MEANFSSSMSGFLGVIWQCITFCPPEWGHPRGHFSNSSPRAPIPDPQRVQQWAEGKLKFIFDESLLVWFIFIMQTSNIRLRWCLFQCTWVSQWWQMLIIKTNEALSWKWNGCGQVCACVCVLQSSHQNTFWNCTFQETTVSIFISCCDKLWLRSG